MRADDRDGWIRAGNTQLAAISLAPLRTAM
jgi:hypothetical protein